MKPDIGAIVAELKAREDIRDVLIRYCRSADRCDLDLMLSCYHDDAEDDHGFFNGPASEFARFAVRSLGERFVRTKHYTTNETIQLGDGAARVESYVLAIMRESRDGALYDVTLSARYLDRFEYRDGNWRIVHRTLVSEGTRVDPVLEQVDRLDQGQQGARGANDPSHALFAVPGF